VTGAYEFASLPAGPIRLEFQRPGFQTLVIRDVAIGAGPTQRDARLEVGSASQTVDVSAVASAINTTTASVSGPGGGRNAGTGRALGSGAGLGGREMAKFAPPAPAGAAGGMLGLAPRRPRALRNSATCSNTS
jgi:hypothetical protein